MFALPLFLPLSGAALFGAGGLPRRRRVTAVGRRRVTAVHCRQSRRQCTAGDGIGRRRSWRQSLEELAAGDARGRGSAPPTSASLGTPYFERRAVFGAIAGRGFTLRYGTRKESRGIGFRISLRKVRVPAFLPATVPDPVGLSRAERAVGVPKDARGD